MNKLISAVLLGLVFVFAVLWLLGPGLTPIARAQGGTGLVRVDLTGTDTPGCGSVALPCATVQFAIDEAIPGDTVILSAGTWNESVTLSQPISLTGVSSATAIIQAVSGQRVLTVTGAAIDGSVVISGLTFTGGDVSGGNNCASVNTTNCGGGILLTGNAQPSIQNVIIENNNAHMGGGLYADETGGLILDGVIFRNNTSILSGGGLNAPNTPVTVTNSLFQQNTTTNNVGGALATGATFGVVAPVLISNTTFLSNTAQCGGSICDAPAVRLFDQDVQIINSYFEGNNCTDPDCDGGGVNMSASFNNPTLSLVNTDFINNTAGGGGGVSVGNLAQMAVTNGRFENNRALSGEGGGLDHSNFLIAAIATISGTQFISNSAALDGGGLYSVSDMAISNATFERNSSGQDGGGLLIDFGGAGSSLTNTTFLANTSQSEGGGAFVFGSNLTVSGGSFANNSAVADGGGLHACGNVTLTGIILNDNTAQENGGGVYVGPREGIGGCGGGANEVVVSNSRFESNVSQDTPTFFSEGGGGLYVAHTGSSLTVNNTDFIGNRAESLGGGVHAFGTTILNGGLFQNNTATASNGGGIRAAGSLTVDGAQFSDNVSGFAGGGAQVGGPADIRNTIFQNNQADNGGGLHLSDAATIDNVQLVNNRAITGAGGGLVSTFAPLTVTNSLLQDNNSAGSGGGLSAFATFGDTINVTDSQIVNNTAEANGGGLNLSGAFFITGTLIQNNQALNGNGGGLYTASAANFGGNWEVSNNSAAGDGGGIWANSGLNATNGRIENNSSGGSGGGFYGGLGSLTVNGTIFANNQAGGGDGGGAYAFDGRAIGKALFDNNTATGAGGGLFLQRFAHITTTQFLGNDANLGGGLAISRTNTGSFVQFVHNSLFARNTATTSGAGIYWNQPRPIDLIHNTIASPGSTSGAAIHIVTGTVNITNNIIANHTTGIQVVGGAVTENYNLFSGNTTNTSGPVGGGIGSLTGNPAFQNPASDDYHLSIGSAAVDQGIDAGITEDFDGDVRPANSGFDMGYDEADFNVELTISKIATPSANAPYHGEITYTVVLSNDGGLNAANTTFTDTLPTEVDFNRWVQQPAGATITNDEIGWQGTVPANGQVAFTFVVSHVGTYGDVVNNTAEYSHASSGNTASAIFTVEPDPGAGPPAGDIYLPIIMANAGSSPPPSPSAPDLIVDSLAATSAGITVTIKNIGAGPVVDAFWVDVYINPDPPPTGVNQPWEDLGDEGMAWGVVGAGLSTLTPGGTLTLTIGGPYYDPSESSFSLPLAQNDPVYAQVDSINFATNYGNVPESNEGNNITGTVVSASAGSVTVLSAGGGPEPPADAGLPARRPQD